MGAARSHFEKWCRDNGYDEKTVFLAGWMALTKMPHEQRTELFSRVADWEAEGYTPPVATAKPRRTAGERVA